MKLYTKGHVLTAALGSALATLVLIVLALVLLKPGFLPASLRTPATVAGSPADNPGAPTPQSPPTTPGQGTVLLPVVDIDEKENIDVYDKYNEAVVNITTEVLGVNWFLDPVPQQGGSGSGSIIDKRGYVLTNYHVIKGAIKLYINLSGGARLEAKVIGSDTENDLAVIKFEPPRGVELKTIPFGTSSSLKVGQKVLAIGNPFGLERTLTQGIVSGIGRPVKTDENTIIRDMIQTDASINPGNSGGPLLNSHGEMIGINAMIYSTSGGSVGIGFAVPVDTARRIVPDLIANGTVKRGWIDIQGLQLFPDLVDYMKQNGFGVHVEKGLLVSQVDKGGNADKAGIRGGATPVRYGSTVFNLGGDIIVSVDGMAVASSADLHSALEDNKPGEKVIVEFWRGNAKKSVSVILSDRRQETK